jgi:hypothetical protein
MVAAREAAAGAPLSQPLLFGGLLLGGALAVVAGFGLVRLAAPILIERMLLGGR